MGKSIREMNMLGIMSGTSLDGLDLALARFRFQDGRFEFDLKAFKGVSYSSQWKERLEQAKTLSFEDGLKLEHEWTLWVGNEAKKFLSNHSEIKVDGMGFHGQTLFHQPEIGFTHQMGSGALLNSMTGIPVVSDFRRQDLGMGGQGAPLVPVGDWLLFEDYDACLNLGGFANASFKKSRLAYDLSACNRVLDAYAQKLGFPFDPKGEISAKGKILPELMGRLAELEYYQAKPPKSLGQEWIERHLEPILSNYEEENKVEDLLHTFTKHIAQVIGQSFEMNTQVLVTGGGVYNDFLIKEIQNHSPAQFTIPEREILEGKEALIFAFLAYLRMNGQDNIYQQVTGSNKDHSAGAIYG